jgi:hypothetical protein
MMTHRCEEISSMSDEFFEVKNVIHYLKTFFKV